MRQPVRQYSTYRMLHLHTVLRRHCAFRTRDGAVNGPPNGAPRPSRLFPTSVLLPTPPLGSFNTPASSSFERTLLVLSLVCQNLNRPPYRSHLRTYLGRAVTVPLQRQTCHEGLARRGARPVLGSRSLATEVPAGVPSPVVGGGAELSGSIWFAARAWLVPGQSV